MAVEVRQYRLKFITPAKTSRGEYEDRIGWYIVVDDVIAGECAPLPDLSSDFLPLGNTFDERCKEYERILKSFISNIPSTFFYSNTPLDTFPDALPKEIRQFPSMLFGIESARWNLCTNRYKLLHTRFAKSEIPIVINGLVWMGSYEKMKEQIVDKLSAGFHCIKLKIGSIDFDKELSLIEQIRSDFSPEKVVIRVDANGAFSYSNAIKNIERLSHFSIHSIEQPIKAGNWSDMSQLSKESAVPIALDEELIGVNDFKTKELLLTTIKPQYIVLKPTLHGGISGTFEWVSLARKYSIGYWLTSALESNVGLETIAHLSGVLADKYSDTATLPQGLGTGLLFTENTKSALSLSGEKMFWKR